MKLPVLAVLWVAGAALEVACVVSLYEVGSVLVRLAGGIPERFRVPSCPYSPERVEGFFAELRV